MLLVFYETQGIRDTELTEQVWEQVQDYSGFVVTESFQYFYNFLTDPECPEIKFYRTGLTYAHILR